MQIIAVARGSHPIEASTKRRRYDDTFREAIVYRARHGISVFEVPISYLAEAPISDYPSSL